MAGLLVLPLIFGMYEWAGFDGQLITFFQFKWIGRGNSLFGVIILQDLTDLVVGHQVPILGCIVEEWYRFVSVGYVRGNCGIVCDEVLIPEETNNIILAPRREREAQGLGLG